MKRKIQNLLKLIKVTYKNRLNSQTDWQLRSVVQ